MAARLTAELGAAEVVERAQRLGIHSELHTNMSIALGTAEVGLIELTGAYASFANGGLGVLPHIITDITTLSGEVVYRRDGSGAGRVVSQRNVQAMNDMLAEVVASGTGRRAALDDHPAAGKTGTSQESRDAWFIGYTAHLVAGVWVGNDDSRPMHEVTGGGLPASIWGEVMGEAHGGLAPTALPGSDWQEPHSIVDLLRDLSVATIQDLLSRDVVSDGSSQGGSAGNLVDEITESTR